MAVVVVCDVDVVVVVDVDVLVDVDVVEVVVFRCWAPKRATSNAVIPDSSSTVPSTDNMIQIGEQGCQPQALLKNNRIRDKMTCIKNLLKASLNDRKQSQVKHFIEFFILLFRKSSIAWRRAGGRNSATKIDFSVVAR